MDHKGRTSRVRSRNAHWGRWVAIVATVALFGAFVSATAGGAQAAPIGSITITLTPPSQALQTGQTATITATVVRTNTSAPVVLAAVAFTVTGVNPTSGTRLTNSNGQASFSYSGSTSGEDTITATVNSTDSNSVTIDWSPGAPTLTFDTTSQTADVGTAASLTARLDRPSGTVDNIPVRYTVTGANPGNGHVNTDSNGDATITYTGVTVGTDTITAYADLNSNGSKDSGEPSATSTVTWIGITISLTPSTQTLSLGSDASIDASVLDGTAGVQGVRVRYMVSGANTVGGSVFTDSNGDATIKFSGTYAGTDTVTAYADLNTNNIHEASEPSDTATVVWSGAGLTLSPSIQTVGVGTHASVTATLTNTSVDNSGVTIRYSITGANTATGSVTTDTNGNATINDNGSSAGTDTVTAFADFNLNGVQDTGEPSATATVTRTGSMALKLTPAQSQVTVRATAYVGASLTSGSSGVSNVTIRYSVSGANPNSGSGVTDGNGNTVIAYAGHTAGTDTLSAYADLNGNNVQNTGEPTASVTITWVSPTTTPPSPIFMPAQPASPKAGCTYFAATQHNLCAGFLAYWNKYGGLAVFGMPLTEELKENGTTVLYTERARFEWHPGTDPAHFDVLLGLLGSELTHGRGTEMPFQPATAKTTTGCTYFAATGHNLCGGFAAYWTQFGGLAIYGYPISEEFQEKNPDTGQVYTVQYFQRGRFEWHPGEAAARYDVELGRLGAQALQMRYGVSYS